MVVDVDSIFQIPPLSFNLFMTYFNPSLVLLKLDENLLWLHCSIFCLNPKKLDENFTLPSTKVVESLAIEYFKYSSILINFRWSTLAVYECKVFVFGFIIDFSTIHESTLDPKNGLMKLGNLPRFTMTFVILKHPFSSILCSIVSLLNTCVANGFGYLLKKG